MIERIYAAGAGAEKKRWTYGCAAMLAVIAVF
jgi:hypothetical protein